MPQLGRCKFRVERVAPPKATTLGLLNDATIAFLFGSMFGACVGFLTAGIMHAVRSSNHAAEAALAARPDLGGHAPTQIDDDAPLAARTVKPV